MMAAAGSAKARALCLLAVLLTTPGCASTGRGGPDAGRAASTPASSASAAQPDFCRVELPVSWQTALTAGRVPHQPGEALAVQAVAADASSLFADSYLSGVRQLVWLRERGTKRTPVLRFTSPDQQVFGAAYDGRWLVFALLDGAVTASPWTMYAWDSTATDPPRALVHSTVPAPYPVPVLYQGVTFWTQPVDGQRSQLHMADLAAHTDRVIRDGAPGAPFLFGSLVVWAEILPGQDSASIQTHAADAKTGRQLVSLPRELSTSLRRPAFLNGDADSVVWAARDPDGLRVWRRGAAAPVTILSATPSGQNLQWPKVASALVAWDNGAAQLVADLRSGSYAQLTPQAGSTMLAADALLVGYPPAEKAAHPILEWSIVRPSNLPALPRCG